MSSPPGFELLRPAPELVANVVKQVSGRRGLSHIRLACKALNEHVAKELFKDVQDDVIRRMPRHAIIHTRPDIEDHGLGMTRERVEVDEDDEDALAGLSRFPNIDSLEISFTPECIGGDDDGWQKVIEDASEQERQLTLILHAIKNRAADEKNRTIRKLTIINPQNCPIPEFTSSDLFRDVMVVLEELHITMVQEYNEHGPDDDNTKMELQTFPACLCSHWLKPVAVNLKALSIYSESENWGPFPG
ncbi:hypothetical protein G6011_02026 [Alternaria panax]|uniref:F-box domain-containing protein n=1 Tax=Alternaria panax TaxID=48097 RepID=A0AAD4FFQ2_9PLEO|nr:hypothetical protein G6011_02026 [Alternaria panax]